MPPEQAGIACPGLVGAGRAKGISKKTRWLQLQMDGYLGEGNGQDIYKMKSSFRGRNKLLMTMEKLSTRHSSLMYADKR